ncbi:inorganic phosphate transporter 1-11-like [Vitis riparia]|uniref:inorganic phosphate transporter 1-11-like n=1 Tax=Vitis riparia TaxID=96939 RepID=UPI00155A5F5A|nr:inorganic phosphate transporter 1-11-like [Vitis riparia]
MSNSLAVLHALDSARTQWYHITAIIIAGMGFFTDAYDLFCISTISKLLGRLYYYDHAKPGKPGKLPHNVNNAVVGVALFGTLTGQLVFGWMGDKLGRKRVYGFTLILMVVCAICSGLSFGYSPKAVIITLCFFRFWLGFGIGGDYPLSATIMSEYANKKTRGAFIAAVFAMQGMGIIFAGLVSMILSKLFLLKYETVSFREDPVRSTQRQADYLWRIVLMLGALPALLTYYWRMKMPETGRYTALIEGNAKQAAADMGRVLEIEIQEEADKVAEFKAANEYSLWSREFFNRHGLHLIGTMSTWFLLDIAFYSQNLTQKDIFPAMNLVNKDYQVSALREMFETSRAMFVVALLGTFPGYWFTVFFIERIGRYIIQLVGFFMMSLFMLIIGIKYEYLRDENKWLFAVLYGLTFFFANFGPNSTTFVLPAELFPTRVRSTCHAMSAAAGKAGAMIGAFVVATYTLDGKANEIRVAMITMACTNMLGFFCTFLVTETKGRSLEEISGEDGGNNETQMPSTPSK